MNSSVFGAQKVDNSKNFDMVNRLTNDEISLFQLKFSQNASLQKNQPTRSLFSLSKSIPYPSDISSILSQTRYPLDTLWALFSKTTSGNPVYVIFTPTETFIWSPESAVQVQKINIGRVEKGKAILCDTEKSIALVAATHSTKFLVVPDIFNPFLLPMTISSSVKTMCVFGLSQVLVTFNDYSASIFNLELKSFTEVPLPKLFWMNPLRAFKDYYLSQNSKLLYADNVLYGFNSGYITIYNRTNFQSVDSIPVPKGEPISIDYCGGTIFILTSHREVVRVQGADDVTKKLFIYNEPVPSDMDGSIVAALSEKHCVVCGKQSMMVFSFTDLTASLRFADSYENFVLGCWSDDDGVQLLSSQGGASKIGISDPEENVSQVDKLTSIFKKYFLGQQIINKIRESRITKKAFDILDTRIANDGRFSYEEKIVFHRSLHQLATSYFGKFDDRIFSSNLLKLSLLRSASICNFGECTEFFRHAAETNETNSIFSLITSQPDLFAESLAILLESAFKEIGPINFTQEIRDVFLQEVPQFDIAINLCLNNIDVDSQTYAKLVEFFTLTQPDDIDPLMRYHAVHPHEALKIAIKAKSFNALAKIIELTNDVSILEDIEKELGPSCIDPIVKHFNEKNIMSALLKIGKYKPFRPAVCKALSNSKSLLAFQLIQEDTSDQDLLTAAQLFYSFVITEFKTLIVQEAVAFLSMGIVCLQAIGEGKSDMELYHKLQNRIMVLSLQRTAKLGDQEIIPSTELVNHFIAEKQMGTALSIIGSTYDDRSDEENASLLVDAILIESPSNSTLIPLLVSTIAAKNIPNSLSDVLTHKIENEEKRKDIMRAFKTANKEIQNEGVIQH